MDIEKAYQELERHLVEGETLLEQLDPESGLSWRHHEWGEYAKTVIAVIDPHGKIFEKSSPVGMFFSTTDGTSQPSTGKILTVKRTTREMLEDSRPP